MKSIASSVLLLLLLLAPSAAAQTPRQDLVSLLPDDFAICVVMNDLRGNSARWEQAAWYKSLWQSALGKSLHDTPEMKQLLQWQADLKRHFNLDWPTLRDDILGDAVLFAYSPGSKTKPHEEHGLFLLHARKPDRLVQFIDRFNEAQLRSKELKALSTLEYKGTKYHHRAEPKKDNYYVIVGNVLAFTDNEAVLHAYLDRRTLVAAKTSIWTERFDKAGADKAFATICINPSKLEPDFGAAKNDVLPSYWRALESLFVTLTMDAEAEVRVTVRANADQLPKWARSTFTKNSPASTLWQHFPERSLLTIASRTDFSGAAETLELLMPEKDRAKMREDWQRSVGAIINLDPFKDILPNLGPDWGVCVLAAKKEQHLPIAVFALAVKPGDKGQKVDENLYKMVHMFAGFAALDHNNKNPNNLLRRDIVMQGKVEVTYLSSDKLFPADFQPACALKDGYMLFATSPEGIEQFQKHDGKATMREGETPIVRVSTREVAKLLQQRREHILQKLPEKNLENVVALLGLFDRITLSQRSEPGQASWSIRLTPGK